MLHFVYMTPIAKERISIAAAAAAKSLQSRPTLCDPIDGSPPGSPVPGILQARVLEWVAIALAPFSLHIQYLLFVFFLMITILTDVQ